MQTLNTKTHGYIDYSMGIILIAVAYLLSSQTESTPSTVLYAVGAMAIVYSLLTNYELGFLKIIPIKLHLMLDTNLSIFLAASPWLLGFDDKVFLPHLILGLMGIGAAILTNIKPEWYQNKKIKLRKRKNRISNIKMHQGIY